MNDTCNFQYDEAAQISNEKQNTDTIPKIQMGSTEELNLTEEASVVSISSGKKKRPGKFKHNQFTYDYVKLYIGYFSNRIPVWEGIFTLENLIVFNVLRSMNND